MRNVRWRSERLVDAIYRAAALNPAIYTAREDEIIARKSPEANMNDHVYPEVKLGWFTTKLPDDSMDSKTEKILDMANQKNRSIVREDTIKECLAPYSGNVHYYRFLKEVRLWDMSEQATLSYLESKLNANNYKKVERAFRLMDVDGEQVVVRYSDEDEDKELCRMLKNKFPEFEGWYHPTLFAGSWSDDGKQFIFNYGIHRREIVLVDPETKITRDVAFSKEGSPEKGKGIVAGEPAAPKRHKPNNKPNNKENKDYQTRKQLSLSL